MCMTDNKSALIQVMTLIVKIQIVWKKLLQNPDETFEYYQHNEA